MKTIQRRPVFYKLTKQQREWLKSNCCPICGLPESKWKRRTDWRCCSVNCTNKFSKITYVWQWFKHKAFKRDKYSCVKCGEKPIIKTYGIKRIHPDTSKLIGDHIIPIAIGGKEYDLKNVQTLCEKCNKIKTKKDFKKIALYRKQHKSQLNLLEVIRK